MNQQNPSQKQAYPPQAGKTLPTPKVAPELPKGPETLKATDQEAADKAAALKAELEKAESAAKKVEEKTITAPVLAIEKLATVARLIVEGTTVLTPFGNVSVPAGSYILHLAGKDYALTAASYHALIDILS